jgi:hypothetical protein
LPDTCCFSQHGCRTPAVSEGVLTARCADTCCFSRCSESQVSRHLLFQQVFCKHGWTSAAAYHTPMLGLGEGRATLLLLRLGGACLLSYAGVGGWEGAPRVLHVKIKNGDNIWLSTAELRRHSYGQSARKFGPHAMDHVPSCIKFLYMLICILWCRLATIITMYSVPSLGSQELLPGISPGTLIRSSGQSQLQSWEP